MRRVRAGTAIAALAVLAAGCGGSGRPAAPSSTAGAAESSAGRSATAPPGPVGSSAGPSAVPSGGASAGAAAAPAVPRFAHVLVVVEENHAQGEIIGNRSAPYMNSLARSGALFTRSYAIRHPSYPNYLALFSGSTHGIRDDSCPHYYRGDNLGHQLRAAHRSFAGYADALPRSGYRGCTAGPYARRHAPWVDFVDLPRSLSRPMTAFPHDYARLPALAFVTPDVDHDMHDGTIRQADSWLRAKLSGYVRWARTHDSLLVLTWDEDDRSAGNRIPTVFAGAHVRPGHYSTRVDHYRVLRTLEAAFGLRPLGQAAHRSPITSVWRR
jgi:acid phosphatase